MFNGKWTPKRNLNIERYFLLFFHLTLKRQLRLQLQQTANFATSFLISTKIRRSVCQQTILMEYHALFVTFENAAKFGIIVGGALWVKVHDNTSLQPHAF